MSIFIIKKRDNKNVIDKKIQPTTLLTYVVNKKKITKIKKTKQSTIVACLPELSSVLKSLFFSSKNRSESIMSSFTSFKR